MRIAVLVFLHLERLSPFLEQYRNLHVDRLVVIGSCRVVLRFDVLALERAHSESALEVNQRDAMACAVVDKHRWDTCVFGHTGVVGPKRRCRVHDSRAVFGRDKISWNDLKGRLRRVHGHGPVQECLVAHADEFTPVQRGDNFVLRGFLVPKLFGHKRLSQDHVTRSFGVPVARFDKRVRDVGAHRQRGVRRQRPRGGRPSQKVHGQAVVLHPSLGKQCCFGGVGRSELRHNGGVLHVPVCARLVQFVRTQPRPRHGAVRLDGVALVEHALLVQLCQQPPHRFHVLRVVRDVWGFHVDPVAHLPRQLIPFGRVAHDRLATRFVVGLNRDFGPNVLLGDAEFFLDAQFHRKSVCVPSCFAFDAMSFQGLEPAKNVLDCTRHDVVNPWLSIGGGRSLKKDVRLVGGPLVHTLLEGVFAFPNLEPLFGEGWEVQRAAFRKFQRHGCVRNVIFNECWSPARVWRGLRPRR